ncbi:CPBP family intramembrane metalloprotease [Dysgonomonas sp. 25]|nr:CPBP family intramembrane metalloprotease [Dysgonomonas sp. 25]
MTAASLLTTLALVFLFWRLWDKQSMLSLGFKLKGHISEFWAGSLIAAAVMGIGFVVLLLTNNIVIESTQFVPSEFIGYFILFILVSLSEEILCRGYMLGSLMKVTNKFTALIISSAFFAAMHLFNPNLGMLPMLNLFLAGLLLGAAYMYTRNLWLPVGMHLFWNFVQGPVLGYNVSGTQNTPILSLSYPENNILNGGAFGFEGSVICSVLCIIGTLAIIAYYEKKKPKEAMLSPL